MARALGGPPPLPPAPQVAPALEVALEPEEATRRAPDLAVCHRMVAWAAGEVKGQERPARDAANHAVRLSPFDAENHTCAGTVAMEMGDHPFAERALVEALRLDPSEPLARHGLAVLHTRQGRLVDATHGLLSSAAMDPHQALVPHNLTSVILVWLPRTHWGMWGTYLVLEAAAGAGGPVSWPAVGVMLLGLALLTAGLALVVGCAASWIGATVTGAGCSDRAWQQASMCQVLRCPGDAGSCGFAVER
jgi:hypothetical protein